MPETNYKIATLIVKHLNEEITAPEQEELNVWLESSGENKHLLNRYTQEYIQNKLDYFSDINEEAGWKKLSIALPGVSASYSPQADASATTSYPATDSGEMPRAAHRIHFLKTSWFRYAAAIMLLIGGVALGYEILKPVQDDGRGKRVQGDIAPGGERAVLTLADGSTIVLDDAQNGNITHQGNTKIIKLDQGQLAYRSGMDKNSSSRLPAGEVLYNTISTPRSGQYQIVLPDQTVVHLNAESSVRFPTSFSPDAATREISVTGEVYVEVSKNKAKPFIVHVNNEFDIKVLGTSFIVNAYKDEPYQKTILVEGSVRLTQPAAGNKDYAVTLNPGQQAQRDRLPGTERSFKISKADVQEALAWKNGFFVFNDISIEPIMRQLSRWYDVEIAYEGNVTNLFYATVPRNAPLSEVLKALQLTGSVKFRLEGRKVIVMP